MDRRADRMGNVLRVLAKVPVVALAVMLSGWGGASAVVGQRVSAVSLAPYVVGAGEESGFSAVGAPTFISSAAAWTAGDPTAAGNAKRLHGEGFRGGLNENTAGVNGAAGVSWVIELASPAAAKSEQQAQLREIAAQSPSPVTRFAIKYLPNSVGFTSRANSKIQVDPSETPTAEVDATVLFVEGSCVLLVGDQTASRINPNPPVIGGALTIYGRTAHSGGVCG
jgi:hypothetical protein